MTKLLFLARPTYGPTEPEADNAARNAVREDSSIIVHDAQFRQSMTSNNCNNLFCTCLTRGGYDYFAMQHADVAPAHGWCDTLVEQLELHDYDVIHAPVRFKNETGITSTAVGYGVSVWAPVRRITTAELKELPQTFDIDVLKKVYDPAAERILLNTGCMVCRLGDWAYDFPGFTMWDRIVRQNGKWCAITVSEDYVFGHWCADNGVRVGATKVTTGHVGRKIYSTDDVCGPETDEQYLRDCAELQEAMAI